MFNTLSAKATRAKLTLVPTIVQADFHIFLGNENIVDGPAAQGVLLLLNNPPSCDDIANSQMFNTNGEDAAAGFKCDGCGVGTPPPEWVIDRLEIRNEPAVDGTKPFPNLPACLNLYGSGGGNYNPIFGDANGSQDGSIGNCFRTLENPPVQCFLGINSIEIWDSLTCVSDPNMSRRGARHLR